MTSPFNMEFRKIAATMLPYSSGRPSRDGSGTVLPNSSRTFSGKLSNRGVKNKPGACLMRDFRGGLVYQDSPYI